MHQVLAAALKIFDLHCGMRDLQLQHVESRSLTRDATEASCFGSWESQPRDYQGSPLKSTRGHSPLRGPETLNSTHKVILSVFLR